MKAQDLLDAHHTNRLLMSGIDLERSSQIINYTCSNVVSIVGEKTSNAMDYYKSLLSQISKQSRLRNWCSKNSTGYWSDVHTHSEEDRHIMMFKFEKAEDAVLFKLKFSDYGTV